MDGLFPRPPRAVKMFKQPQDVSAAADMVPV
jgi:hypothetical protein